jgi:hypothetical protein
MLTTSSRNSGNIFNPQAGWLLDVAPASIGIQQAEYPIDHRNPSSLYVVAQQRKKL